MGMPGIVISIGADTRDAIAGINKVEKALGRTLTPTEKLSRVMDKALIPALLGAGAAAGAFAVKLGVDAVKAAAAEANEVAKLNTVLGNLGFADASASVDAWVDATQYATNVTDSELRASLERLLPVTKDVTEAQGLLSLAIDASAGSGKPLATVIEGLTKAAAGQTTQLTKLFPELKKVDGATTDLDTAVAALSQTYAGSASASVKSYEGQIKNVQLALSELQESLGTGILDAFSEAVGGSENSARDLTDALRDLQPVVRSVGGLFGTYLGNIANIAAAFGVASDAVNDFASANPVAAKAVEAFGKVAGFVANGPIITLINALGGVAGQLNAVTSSAWAANQAIGAIGGGDFGTTPGYTGGTPTAAYTKEWTSQTVLASRAWAAARDAAAGAAKSYGSAGSAAAGAAAKTKELTKEQQKQIDTINRHVDKLDRLKAKYDEAAKAQADYAASISQSLVANVSIGKAFEDALATAGTESAISFADAFKNQIDQSIAFSKGLAALAQGLGNTPGAQLLIDQIGALGAPAGNELLAGLTVETARGYATSMQSAVDAANAAGVGIAGVFYGEGTSAALGMMTAMEETFAKDTKRLKKMGEKIGEDIASGIREAIASALAQIDATVKSATTATGASTRSASPTYNITVTGAVDPVGVSRQIKRILATGDMRSGRGA